MNNYPFRAPHAPSGGPTLGAGRSAALLIDFDNVTMNVRSDLGKELKSLLDSEVFRGKIAVRRAYADWRRYPASVVPLTEASIDLIFAPAYGTSKKNATDLRMAVDAIELAFMRPEIGVFILLTGDSDFSSCVMKLKEYGKYVIGVGMRESASDLLIQNCDEYYSYHNLSGLTRATEDTGVREDPWELARKAVQTMTRRGDVMRVDRLKQVMVELDSGFSEKDLGYGKFSKFISEAQQRGVLRVRKTDQGDWEVMPAAESADGAEPRAERPERDGRERERERERDRGRRGRGRFGDRYRERDRPRLEAAAPAEAEAAPGVVEEAPAVPVFAEPDVEAPAREAPAREAPAAAEAPAPAGAAAPAEPVDPLRNAYALLQHALRQMVRRPGEVARDGDVKRRMLELSPGFDEHTLGFSKFSRFLRQAHDAEVVDVRRQEDGGYEVLLPSGGKRLPEPVLGAAAPRPQPRAEEAPAAPAPQEAAAPERGARGGRGRGRRGAPAGAAPVLPGQVVGGEAQPAAAEAPAAPAEAPAREPEMTPAQAIQEAEAGALIGHREPAVATARIEDPASIANRGSSTSAGAVGVRGRGARGRRGGIPEGPPPLLPGQVIAVGGARAEAPAPQPAEPAAPRAEAPAAEPAREERGRGRGRGRGRQEAAPAEAQPAAAPAFDAARMGLPTDRDGIVQRVATYNFVGRATGEALADAYGADTWRMLDQDPDAVRELLGARKARPLLDQWGAERDQLIANAAAPAPAEEAPAPAEAPAPVEAEAVAGDTDTASQDVDGGRSRSRRGRGRGRGRTSADEASSAQAEAVVGDTDPTLLGDAGLGEAPAGEETPTPAAQAEDVIGDTDPTLVGDAVTGEAPRGRSRSRRGGRGRGRGRAGGAETAETAAAEAPAPEPVPAPEPAPEPAAEARPGGSRRGRGGRGGERNAPAEAAAPAPAPAPAPEPAAEARPSRSRGGRGGRGGARNAPAEAAAPAPAPEPTPEKAAGGGRGRGRGGRGNAPAEAAAPAPPAPEPAPAEAAGGGARSRSRRRGGRGRGSRGRGGGSAE